MSNDHMGQNDPMSFVRNLWSNMGFSLPGMVTPTFDTEELEKRIKDLKAVEGWLRMNLSMLQMTIQGLEMQATTLSTVKAMGSMAANAAQQAQEAARQAAQDAADHAAQQRQQPASEVPPASAAAPDATPGEEAAGAFSQAAMWPWSLMQQMQEQLQEQAEAAKARNAEARKAAPKAAKSTAKKPAARKPAAKKTTT